MSEYDDWPVGNPNSVGLAILLPGRNYPATMPLLTFAGRAALQHGWRVRAVSWDAPDLETTATIEWAGAQLEGAVADYSGPVLVVAKSLGTCSARRAALCGYDAIWLTPLLHLPEVVEAMAAHPGRQLLVGGSHDPAWDLEVARTVSADVAEIEGADHAMFSADAVHSAEMHVDVTRVIDRWLRPIP